MVSLFFTKQFGANTMKEIIPSVKIKKLSLLYFYKNIIRFQSIILIGIIITITAAKKNYAQENLFIGNIIENDFFRIEEMNDSTHVGLIILETLTKIRSKILKDLDVDSLAKITIKLYPSIEIFHKSVNMQNANNWMVGTVWGMDEFRMVSPLSPNLPISYKVMTEILPVHEFTHIVTMRLADPRKIPYWLWEGIALYYAGQKTDLRQLIKNQNQLPDFKSLNNFQNAFTFGYSLVECIINNWGKDSIPNLLKNDGNIESVFEIESDQFIVMWMNFIQLNYF